LNIANTETAVLPSRIGSPHSESRKLYLVSLKENDFSTSVEFITVINTLKLKVLTSIEKIWYR